MTEYLGHQLIAGASSILMTFPPGCIVSYGGEVPPEGWLKCDGGAISRTIYKDLFSVIGTAYGAGDGNTTFNLPNKTVFIIDSDDTATGGYNIYSNGYYEEWGTVSSISSSESTITLSKEMKNSLYCLNSNTRDAFSGTQYSVSRIVSTTSIAIKYSGTGTTSVCWKVSGFLAEGQYNTNYKQIIKY